MHDKAPFPSPGQPGEWYCLEYARTSKGIFPPGRGLDGTSRQGLPELVTVSNRPWPTRALSRARVFVAALALLPSASGCRTPEAPAPSPSAAESETLGRVRRLFARIGPTLDTNYKSFEGPRGAVSGFGAGDAYPQIWLRDSAWIVDAAASRYEEAALTSWLDLHLAYADSSGRLRDWVAKGPPEGFREWAPHVDSKEGLSFDTNSNESDQEPSAALAHCRTERLIGRTREASPAHAERLTRLIAAMEALVRDRTDPRSGLIWSGLTADWGDVSPLYPDQRSIYRDRETPRTLSLYSNTMAFAAFDCLASLEGPSPRGQKLSAAAARLRGKIRSSFWMEDRGFFRIRLPLDRLPAGFSDDGERFALGGNALAVLFGVADETQAASVFEAAETLRAARGFSTISTTLIPPYAAGVFKHPAMREPSRYQNGGQWDWFGAVLVEAEFERGFSEQARAHLDQIAARILAADPGIHEWYAQDGSPQGSPAYAAAAATLYRAVVKGLLGFSRGPEGLRVVVRTGDSFLPFSLEQKAAGNRVVIRQTLRATAIEVEVESGEPVVLICTVLPAGASAAPGSPDRPGLHEVRQVGRDTQVCANTSGDPGPRWRARFALRPLGPEGQRASVASSK